MSALYITVIQIPDSPGEPASQIPAEQVDADVRMMMVGAEVQPHFQEEMSVAELVGQLRAAGGPGAGVADQIAATGADMNGSFGGSDVVMGDASGAAVPGLFNGINLQALAAQLGIHLPNGNDAGVADSMTWSHTQQQQQQQQQAWSAYGQQGDAQQQQQAYGDYGGYDEQRDRDRDRDRERDGRDGPRGGSRGRGRGFGARGRGGGDFPKGKSKRLCNFFAQGG